MEFFAQWIEQRRQNPKYSPNTISSYEPTIKTLTKYQEETAPLTWEDINEDFAIDFAVYLQDKEKKSRNTANKYLSNLKTCFGDAKQKGHIKELVKYSVGISDAENVYLTRMS